MHRFVVALLACALAAVAAAAPAGAQERDPALFGFEKTETGRIGSSQAGAHPSVFTKFTFRTIQLSEWTTVPHGTPERVSVDMPYGLVGNPNAVATCKRADFMALKCPPQSQVGVANPWPGGFTAPLNDRPIYHLESDGTSPVLLGIDVVGFASNFAYLRIQVRPDGGLRTVTDPLPRGTPLIENKLTLWGVPADENPCNPNRPGFDPAAPSPYDFLGGPCPATDLDDWERKPFMTSPYDCEKIPFSILRSSSYEGRTTEHFVSQQHPPLDCDELVFKPSIDVEPTNPTAEGVSGLKVDIDVPQNQDPDERGTPHVRGVQMTFPEGVSINPGTATDLQACSDAAFGKGKEGAAACPAASKIGHLTITTPVLEGPLPGDVYIGQPLAGNRYRLFLYGEGHGVKIKIAGSLKPDPVTGRITASFDDNPPLPWSRLRLEFRGGPRGVLAMPQTCGSKTVNATITPYGGKVANVSDTFQIGGDCKAALPFQPDFAGGSLPATAGAFAPFAMSVTKPDLHQALGGIELDMPDGLLAKVRDVPLCGDADAVAGTCPATSHVGTVTAGSGPGASPLFLPGTVSLTGPYKGAPYGLAIAVPAIAGPYDLGVVVVRQQVLVDPKTADLRVVSDPLPTILEGVPLRIQRIDVRIDRPQFTTNPTACTAKQLVGKLASVSGAAVSLPRHYQARGCKALAFKPKMTLRMTGRKQLTDGKHPGLAVTLRHPGGSNLKQARVKLPLSLALEPQNAEQLCEYDDGQKAQCPAKSIIGKATAVSPLLKAPLSGPVYFVKGVRFNAKGERLRTMPTLLVTLRGEIAIDLRARSDVQHNKLVNTFELVPDAAIETFKLSIDGGKHGILAATRDICGERHVARVELDAQNGKRRDFRARLGTPCRAKQR